MQCTNCSHAARGTVELHVCSAECAQDVGAILGFGKKRPARLFVQGNNADEWKEATPLQQQQYQIAIKVPPTFGKDWASLATWTDPKTKQRWAITRVENNYYMYLSDTSAPYHLMVQLPSHSGPSDRATLSEWK